MDIRRILLFSLAGAALSAPAITTVPSPAAAEGLAFTREAPVSSHLKAPTGIAVDGEGRFYVTESSRDVLHVFSPEGKHLEVLDGLSRPVSTAVDGQGRIYVGNAGRGNVEVYDPDLAPVMKLGSGDGEFGKPGGIAVDGEGKVYVADSRENTVRIYDSEGTLLRSFDGSENGNGPLAFPSALAVDRSSGEIYVTDLHSGEGTGVRYGGARVQAFTSEGAFLREFAAFGVGEGLLVKPLGVAVDGDGRVYVTDAFQNVVQVFDRDGSWLTVLYDVENPLRTPLGIAWEDGGGRILVASLSSGRVETYALLPEPASRLLTLTILGEGTGTVTSDPPGIECPAACTAEFQEGTEVFLTAWGVGGSVFSGWEGDCSGTGACEVTLDADVDVAARFAPPVPLSSIPRDFDGDGISDLLGWDREEETLSLWFSAGNPSPAGYPAGNTAALEVSGVADFDGDGKVDILLRSAAGALTLRIMDGITVLAAPAVDTLLRRQWEVAATGDFDGDGREDLLLRHIISGTVIIWLMDGPSVEVRARVPHSPRRRWEVAGTGDFDGDGRDDVLWREETGGAVSLWLMDGTAVASRGLLAGSSGREWEVSGTGDFSGDGHADVLWRNVIDGTLYLWLVEGLAVTASVPAGSLPDGDWSVSGGSDYNGDGLADALGFDRVTGEIRLWLMDGSGIFDAVTVGTASGTTVFW